MLDVPAIAILAWAAIFTLRFCERDRTSDLAVLSALFVSALYTKQQMAFLAPGLAAVVVWMRGLAVLREKRIWLAAAISVAALVPLAVINLKFARFNVEQAGTAVLQQGHGWWNDWGYYVGGLPAQLGWPLFLSGLLGLALVLTGRSELHHRAFFLFMVGWIVLCYLMFSPIAVKSLRFTLPWVIPWSILGAYAVVRVGRQYGEMDRARRGGGGLASIRWPRDRWTPSKGLEKPSRKSYASRQGIPTFYSLASSMEPSSSRCAPGGGTPRPFGDPGGQDALEHKSES